MSSNEPRAQASELRLLLLVPTNKDRDDPSNMSETSTVFLSFLQGLTGVKPAGEITTFAGYTSHAPLPLRNKYYAADVSLWCDEIRQGDINAEKQLEWVQNMQSNEAHEVRQVIGGIIVLLPYNGKSIVEPEALERYGSLLSQVNTIRDMIEDESGRDIATLAVVQDMTPASSTQKTPKAEPFCEKLEEACISTHGIFGWDIIRWNPSNAQESETGESKNEFGEKQGMPRVLEVLEQTDWSATAGTFNDGNDYELAALDDFSDDEFDSKPDIAPRVRPMTGIDPVSQQSQEFQREIMGLHFALEDQANQETETSSQSGDELQADQILSLMTRASEMKEEASQMSKGEREKFARKEVTKLMRDMKMR